MKILITGANGMLAKAVVAKFASENELILTDAKELDITDLEAVERKVLENKPELIINCAAYTNVDGAELNEEVCRKVNALGPKNLALAAAKLGQEKAKGSEAKDGKDEAPILVHISTDYVFGGEKMVEFDEDTEDAKQEHRTIEIDGENKAVKADSIYLEDDAKNPQSVYGKTKLEAEEAIAEILDKYYIFRTAWLYGEGKNFVRTMIEVSKTHDSVTVVNDQFGSPTFTEDLTEFIYEAVTKHIPFGIYNATDNGFTNWYEFTKKIYGLANISTKVLPVSSIEYEQNAEEAAAKKGEKRVVAKRPKNSMMSKAKLEKTGVKVPTWEDGLKRYLENEGVIAKAAN